jgi:aminopeptidase N
MLPLSVAAAASALPTLADWAGIPDPGRRYDQVFVGDRISGQELAGAAVIRDSYLDELGAEPREDWLVLHELAHSFWGNLVTARSWSDFWLNEGITTFMVAALEERRWDRVAYEQELALGRRRYDRARRAGRDRALVSDAWSRASDMSGPVTYSKGALVMALLRHELGEKAFWSGLRAYTRAGAAAAHGVVTDDLRRAMERASGRALGPFFATWVYAPAGAPELVASHRLEGRAVVVMVEQRARAAGPVTLAVAVETTAGRTQRRLILRKPVEAVRFPLAAGAELRAVRVDDGGVLPIRVRHARPASMLLWQVAHEPDVVGRLEALDALEEACQADESQGEPACAGRAAAFAARAPQEPARLLRKELEQLSSAVER